LMAARESRSVRNGIETIMALYPYLGLTHFGDQVRHGPCFAEMADRDYGAWHT